MDFATKVRVLRALKNWSQEELAKEIGIAWQTVSALENKKNEPQYSTAQKVEKLLKIALRKAGLEYKE